MTPGTEDPAPQAGSMVLAEHRIPRRGPAAGLGMGTRVLTLAGALPVEFLTPGEKVITRAGARTLRAITVARVTGPMMRVKKGVLGFDRPEGEALLAPATRVLIRDWRARALYGSKAVAVQVARLADGKHVAPVAVDGARVFALHFDSAEVIYAEGMEIATEPLRVPAEQDAPRG
jgi:hypothetical protein